jgi:hypothetical protein
MALFGFVVGLPPGHPLWSVLTAWAYLSFWVVLASLLLLAGILVTAGPGEKGR